MRHFHEANVSIAGAGPALEARLRHLDGSWRHFEGVVNNLLDDPNVGGIVINLRDVTERKQAEEALRQSEERLRRLVEQAAEAFFVHDLEGRFVEVNQQACESLGYTKEELLSMSVADVEENFDAQGLTEMWEHIASNGPVTVEGVHQRKDGTRFPVEVRIGLFEAGADRLILAMARDMTERKRAEDTLRASEANLAEAQRIASLGSWEIDLITGEMHWSDEMYRIFGFAPGEVTPTREVLTKATHPQDREIVPEAIRNAVEKRQPFNIDHRVLWPDGEVRVVQAQGEAVFDLSGRPSKLTGTSLDITERKQAEELVKRQADMLEQTHDAVFIWKLGGEITYWNQGAERLYGWSQEEALDRISHELLKTIHPFALEELHNRLQRDGHWEGELVHHAQDGRRIVVESRHVLAHYESGPGFVLETNHDITERKQAEEEVRRSESRLLAAQRIAHVGDWSFDVDGNEAHWSDEMYRIFGLSPQGETLTYKRFLRLVHPEDRATVRGMSREALKGGGQSSIDYRVIRPDGQVRFVHSQYEIKHDASGKTTELVGTLQDVTELRQAEEELRRSEERFRALVQNSLDVVSVVDANATVLYYSPSVEAVMGYKPEEFIGKNALEVVPIHPDDLSHVRDVFSYLVANPGVNYSIEMRLMHANGSWRTVEATANNLLDDPSVGDIVTNYRDITERKRSEEELRKSEATNRAILEATPDLMFIVSRDGEFLDFRTNADNKLYVPREEIIGSNLRDTMPPDLIAPMLHHIAKTLDTGEMQVFEYELPTNDEVLDFEARLVVSGEGEVLSIIRDVTERKALERRLEHQAFHDALTGLPNRALFVDRLEHALIRASRPQEAVAVLFLDLDNFKVVNDSLGHTAGDKLLVAVTERLLTILRPEDTLARLGGDEFTILIESVEANSDVFDIADRVAEALRAPFILEGREVFVTVSIGIALGSSYQDQPGALLRNADLAMYRAKETGKARFEVFDPLMNERALERLRLESELRRALDRNEFRVYYQPTVLLETGKVIGVEALVRWEHPERGLLAPAAFMPLAEETGLIIPLGKWVLEEACRQAKEWHDQRLADLPLTVSVNPSARQFRHPLLFKEIVGVLESSGIKAGALILEITETVMMEGDEYLIDQLRELKASGIKLAIDDFGKSYSCLFYLSRLPVDYLTIDSSYVDYLGERPEARKLVGGIINFASSLDLRLIAEGIETAEQLEKRKNWAVRSARATTSPARSPPGTSRHCYSHRLSRLASIINP